MREKDNKIGSQFISKHVAAFILTLDEEGGQRRRHAADEATSLSLPWQFVTGYRKTDPALDRYYSHRMNTLLHKRPLTSGEIAVYAGHRRMWRAFLESGLEYALILEDDFHVLDQDRLLQTIQELTTHPERWDIVKFFDYKPKPVIASIEIGTATVVAHKYPACGAVAYLMNIKAARSLLRRSRIFRPIDEDLSHPWEFSIRIWSLEPNIVEEVSHNLGGSILEKDRLKQRKKRNILRSLWGILLQGVKLTRSLFYRRKLAHGYMHPKN